jgi:protein transport protein SEC31
MEPIYWRDGRRGTLAPANTRVACGTDGNLQLPATTNWSFEVASCPRNPSYVATASFDGKINITSLQNTAAPAEPTGVQQPQPDNAADIFSAGNLSNLAAQVHPGVSLKQPPRWLRRPASSSFGFGGKLATATNTAAQAGAQPAPATVNTSVKVHQVVTESDIVERAVRLDEATQSQTLSEFCESKKAGADVDGEASGSKAKQEELENWKLLSSLFRADSKDELVTLLGFSKEHVKKGVEEAIKSFKSSTGRPSELPLGMGNRKPASSDSGDGDDGGSIAREPLVTFADQSTNATDAMSGSSEGEGAAAQQSKGPNSSVSDATPSETDASTSIASDATTKIGGAESEVTEPSLFGDDTTPGNAQQQAAADFYSQLHAPDTPSSSARLPSLSERFNLTQHHIDRAGSSIAATIGSRPSSSASDGPKPTTFRIYPQDESEADRLLTRALVLGDFESAVSLCLSADRFADALLLAVRGGSDLLAKTQKAYFERRTTSLPYLRLFQSIISDDLTDVVQNADLGDWQEIFVVLCTFAKTEDYPTLVEQLGQRLEYQLSVARSAGSGSSEAALEQRRSAVLCYLAAGKLEKVINIWIEEMREEEKAIEESLGGDGKALSSSARYTAHAQALQSFVEKVTVFISAVAYVDTELAQPASNEDGARTYKLAQLYDKYSEYAELLAAQGLVTLAVRYAALTPAEYTSPGAGVSTRERLQVTTGQKIAGKSALI